MHQATFSNVGKSYRLLALMLLPWTGFHFRGLKAAPITYSFPADQTMETADKQPRPIWHDRGHA
jgi:hypothetical protein